MEQALRILPSLVQRVMYEILHTSRYACSGACADMSHAQVTCLEPLQMRPAHGSCQRKHRQNKRLQYLVDPAQDKGGQDPQRLFHRSKRDRRWKKNSTTETYTTHGLVRPLGQEDTSGNMNWCSCRNNIAGITGSQRVCSFVCLFVGAW